MYAITRHQSCLGQFISVRGDKDFSSRYSPSYVEPDDLLSNEMSSPDWEYFNVEQPSPSNIPMVLPPPPEPIGNSVDL